MGVADRTLKTFDYISKGLLPLDDSLSWRRRDAGRTNTGLPCARIVGRSRSNSDGVDEKTEGRGRKRKDFASEDAAREDLE